MESNNKNGLWGKIVNYAVIAVLVGVSAFGGYTKYWESRQPKQIINSAIVREIEPYYNSGGDLHWSSSGNRILIEGENRPINFPEKNWDNTVQESDTIDLIIRRSYFGNELDGLKIDDHKIGGRH